MRWPLSLASRCRSRSRSRSQSLELQDQAGLDLGAIAYVVPRPDNRFIIGATEIESEDASPVSVQSMLELCSALYTLNPAFAEARIVELDANLRPCHLDNLPHIDWQLVPVGAGRHQRIVRINGLYRHGFLLAPTLVDQVVAELGEQWHANHNL